MLCKQSDRTKFEEGKQMPGGGGVGGVQKMEGQEMGGPRGVLIIRIVVFGARVPSFVKLPFIRQPCLMYQIQQGALSKRLPKCKRTALLPESEANERGTNLVCGSATPPLNAKPHIHPQDVPYNPPNSRGA